jgi:hypothetical protein
MKLLIRLALLPNYNKKIPGSFAFVRRAVTKAIWNYFTSSIDLRSAEGSSAADLKLRGSPRV